ncbi:hypothetical protein B7L17_011620 [Burkholderia cenocepacia]|uniref:hypothetical protein n=1 Tax=Burkholderia cenocepacia TaxID=95486 RepID=UPI0022372BD4|nr:hypothetical protein [Burkholderia cenocepacia]MCW5118607.1 hypothetical protein [Burkholderia cenocepacia]MCW5130918.1 hypothetical protein [Burkholderia cenocepacia]MCW5174050.1 hypothetical protein [Burkholderia cenocepacia]
MSVHANAGQSIGGMVPVAPQDGLGYSVVDSDGQELQRCLPASTARALVDFYLETDVAFGCSLRVVPSKPIPPSPPIKFDLTPHFAQTMPVALPAVAAGEERSYLREIVAQRAAAAEALDVAKLAAARAQEHFDACERDVARMKAADEAETAAAGASLADRIKAGVAAPLEPNLRTGRNALLDAEARRDAAKQARALLDADVAAAQQALADAERAAQLAADVVIRAEIRERTEQINALWAQITPLRQLVDDALSTGMPVDSAAVRDALKVPDLAWTGNEANRGRFRVYRKALQLDADTKFEDQPEKVTQ